MKAGSHVTEAKVLVRCLGPARKDHWFLSPSKFVRICPACAEKQLRAFVMPVNHVLDGDYYE